MVGTSSFKAGGVGLIPGLGIRSHRPHSQNTKTEQKQYCNKFHKDYKWSTLEKILKKKSVKMGGRSVDGRGRMRIHFLYPANEKLGDTADS